MDEKEKKILRKHLTDITRDVIPTDEFLSSLVQSEIFADNMIQLIKAEKTDTQMVYKMMEMLPRRGPEAFSKFLDLLSVDYQWISKKLEESLQHEKQVKRRYEQDADYDIKQKVSSLVHNKYGQSKKVSEREKHEIERWITGQIQTERRHWCKKLLDLEDFLERQRIVIPDVNSKLRIQLPSDDDSERETPFPDDITELERNVERLVTILIGLRFEREKIIRALDVPQNHATSLSQIIYEREKAAQNKIKQLREDNENLTIEANDEIGALKNEIAEKETELDRDAGSIDFLERSLEKHRNAEHKLKDQTETVISENKALEKENGELSLQVKRLETRTSLTNRTFNGYRKTLNVASTNNNRIAYGTKKKHNSTIRGTKNCN